MQKQMFEKSAWQKNLYCCGIDEVGRGCLAGPLVTGAVILPIGAKYKYLKDSKILTEKERELAYDWIVKNAFYTTAITCHQTIDNINIYQATLKTMHKVFVNLYEKKQINFEKLKYILVDAMPLKINNIYMHKNLELHYFNYGESFSTSIAAASIVAKVTRDNIMKRISPLFPNYTLDQHKGYAAPKHCKSIIEHGATIIHRKTFITKISQEKNDVPKQQQLF